MAHCFHPSGHKQLGVRTLEAAEVNEAAFVDIQALCLPVLLRGAMRSSLFFVAYFQSTFGLQSRCLPRGVPNKCASELFAGAITAWPALRLWEGDAGTARLGELVGAQSVQVTAADSCQSWTELCSFAVFNCTYADKAVADVAERAGHVLERRCVSRRPGAPRKGQPGVFRVPGCCAQRWPVPR